MAVDTRASPHGGARSGFWVTVLSRAFDSIITKRSLAKQEEVFACCSGAQGREMRETVDSISVNPLDADFVAAYPAHFPPIATTLEYIRQLHLPLNTLIAALAKPRQK